jgi:hypothetical protein
LKAEQPEFSGGPEFSPTLSEDVQATIKRTLREVLEEITWDKIAKAYQDYHYFQGIGAFSFRPAPTRGIGLMTSINQEKRK